MKQPMQPVGETEVFWHLALGTDHLEKLQEAAVNAGCEVTVPIRPLDLQNDVTQKLWPVRVAFFRGPDGELVELLEVKTGYT
jgi:catechol 2,3-dioxygenase-like lactoylglutathione lyase family enzyme